MQHKLVKSEWAEWLENLAAFRRTFGHCRVPANWTGIPGLAQWVARQRSEFHRLPLKRLEQLYRFGFDFGAAVRRWLFWFFELADFKRDHGHCNVPRDSPANSPLASWVYAQRRRKVRLPVQRRKLIEALGMNWASMQAQWWEASFCELEAFKKRFGHCRVPTTSAANSALGKWVKWQRSNRAKLSPQRRRRLERLGFQWQVHRMSPRKTWEERFMELVAFHKRFEHCAVPSNWPENPPLAKWVQWQRANKPRLTAQQRRCLESLHFAWDGRPANWELHFAELVAFKKRFGHCNVPRASPTNPRLGRWVSGQRTNRAKLSPQQQRRLDRLGFRWQIRRMAPPKPWAERFRELVAFRKRFGHCVVPQKWPDNPPLAHWMTRQRRGKSSLTARQKRRLEQLGFVWNVDEEKWARHFAELVAFKKQHGHCNVPLRWPENRRLGRWVSYLRERQRKLSAERIQTLNRLGFRWRYAGY